MRIGKPTCTALMKRLTTAVVSLDIPWKRRHKVYQCKGCGHFRCVCGSGALSLGHKLNDKWRIRFETELLYAFQTTLERMSQPRLRIVRGANDRSQEETGQ